MEADHNRLHLIINIILRLKSTTRLLLLLALLRIIVFDFIWILSDLCSALIVYFTYSNPTSLMAIFSLVNGIIGLIYSFVKGMSDIYFIQHYVNSNLFAIFLIFVFSYSVLVYSLVVFYSFWAYKHFPSSFGPPQYQQMPQNPNDGSTHYIAVRTNNQRNNFTAFSGPGTQVGSNVNQQ